MPPRIFQRLKKIRLTPILPKLLWKKKQSSNKPNSGLLFYMTRMRD